MMRFLFVILSLCSLSARSIASESADKTYWIDRYLSVSYPLKSIKVNSSFGIRRDPFTGSRATHSGLDLKASYEEVYSMFDGKVTKTGFDSRSGLYVILSHGDYTVSYCHLSRVTVSEGEGVLAGDMVAISGNSGRSTGPHLHVTARRRGDIVDPYTLLLYIREVRNEAVIALGGIPSDGSGNIDCNAFFDMYADAAMEQQQRYGIPSSVTLAQMAYESSYGRSDLAVSGNNFFGIKCNSEWLASGRPYSLHDDDRPNEKFCNYSSVEESIDHHSRLLMSDRYERCRRYGPTDYHNWLVAIKAAGYATAPDYVRKLESIIKKYKLYLFDSLAGKVSR